LEERCLLNGTPTSTPISIVAGGIASGLIAVIPEPDGDGDTSETFAPTVTGTDGGVPFSITAQTVTTASDGNVDIIIPAHTFQTVGSIQLTISMVESEGDGTTDHLSSSATIEVGSPDSFSEAEHLVAQLLKGQRAVLNKLLQGHLNQGQVDKLFVKERDLLSLFNDLCSHCQRETLNTPKYRKLAEAFRKIDKVVDTAILIANDDAAKHANQALNHIVDQNARLLGKAQVLAEKELIKDGVDSARQFAQDVRSRFGL
jgi:hypothetical protein